MDKTDNNLLLFRVRSSSATISDGYRLYMGNFRRIFRASWPVALVFAIAVSVLYSIIIFQLPHIYFHFYNHSVFYTLWTQAGAMILGANLLYILASILLSSSAYSALSEHQATGTISVPMRWYGHIDKQILIRTFKMGGWMILLYLIVGLFTGSIAVLGFKYFASYARIAWVGILMLITFIVLLPSPYIMMHYVLTPGEHFLSTFFRNFITGMRHAGALFIVMLIVGIITMLLMLITELPCNILYMANIRSQMGTLMGDPAGMPDYMSWLNLIVFGLAGFIQAYIYLSIHFPFYYLYGSIDTQEKEREQIRNNKI